VPFLDLCTKIDVRFLDATGLQCVPRLEVVHCFFGVFAYQKDVIHIAKYVLLVLSSIMFDAGLHSNIWIGLATKRVGDRRALVQYVAGLIPHRTILYCLLVPTIRKTVSSLCNLATHQKIERM
jgi:hypothetical protein